MHTIPLAAAPLALLALVPSVAASDLNLSVESGGSNSIAVTPGVTINYQVVGELDDLLNEGLAGFALDLAFDGGNLAPAAAPTSGNMLQFTDPAGLSNPGGYGGTASGGDLLQIGGIQNTLKNTFTANLSGTVTTGVAWNAVPEVLVSGSLTVPFTPGVYTLSASNVLANVISQGEDGSGQFWSVEEAGVGSVTQLTINVISVLEADIPSVSVASGGTQTLSLDAGAAHAGRIYFVAGSMAGTSPGFPLGLVTLPLNYDVYTDFTLLAANSSVLVNTLGVLDGAGKATAQIAVPPGVNPNLVGTDPHHAYTLILPQDFTSNPVQLILNP